MLIDKEGIKGIIPHREPFLLIDEIIEYEVAKSATAVWHITEDLYFFKGHFPGNPVLPGVLMVEALAQTGAVAILQDERFKGKLALFGGINKIRFRGMVKPGDDLILYTELIKISKYGGTGSVRATVNDKVVCEGEILFVFANMEEK